MIRFKQKNIVLLTPNKSVNYVWQQFDPTGPDADATAFLTAAGITDPTISAATQNLTKDLKNYGIWSKLKAIYPFVGGTATTHKFNLKDPRDLDVAFRLVFSGGWTHSANGASSNGTNAFAETYLIPSTSLLLNSVHIAGYLRTNNNNVAPFMSTDDASNYNNGLYFWPQQPGFSVRANDNTSQTGVNVDARGFHVVLRQASNVKKYRLNNSEIFNVSTSSTGLNTSSIYLAKSRNNNNFFNGDNAFTSIGDGLTDTEAANFYTAVQAFQTTLGRQV